MTRFFPPFLFACFIHLSGTSQKVFHVTIKLSSQEIAQKIQVSYENGRKRTVVKKVFDNNQLIVTDSFFAKYASIYLDYPAKDESDSYHTSIFVEEQPAEILIPATSEAENPVKRLRLKQAYSHQAMGEAKLKAFIKQEETAVNNFLSLHNEHFGNSDSLQRIYLQKVRAVSNKRIEFVRRHGDMYYALWVFRTQIAHYTFVDPDSLLHIFHQTFSHELQNSLEGVTVARLLLAKASTKTNRSAPDFTARDIMGNLVALSGYRGKYVLLNFWATWCVPCMEELPDLQNIRLKYPKSRLEMVAMSGDRDSLAFARVLDQFGNDWTHIFGNWDFKRIYIRSGIPQVILINPEGKVIYNREDEKDDRLVLLRQILEQEL